MSLRAGYVKKPGQLLRRFTHIGAEMQKIARRAEELAKGDPGPVSPVRGAGFQYTGPIDGYNFEHLLPTRKML